MSRHGDGRYRRFTDSHSPRRLTMARWTVALVSVVLLMTTATAGYAQSGSMSGDKMGSGKMDGDKKMDKMGDGKMDGDKMKDDKMGADKMSGEKKMDTMGSDKTSGE